MTEETKITLSPKELELVCNTEWILTKLTIIAKVYQMFGSAAEKMKEVIERKEGKIASVLAGQSPKIFRGENYRQLPYVILDYPRQFGKDETIAIRTMFWWGNFFSLTLQLAGIHKQRSLSAILAKFTDLQRKHYWICVHTSQWEHHFEGDNYVGLATLSKDQFAGILERESFLKLAIKHPLSGWTAAPNFIEESFKEMIDLLETSYQDDGTGLLPGIPTTDFDL